MLMASGMLAVAGCGGGSSSSTSGSGATYAFGVPTVGATATEAVTIVDNSGNTINLTETSTILSVNADGSFTSLTEYPGGDAVVNGTNYANPPTTHDINSSDQETSYSYTDAATGEPVTCTEAPHGLGPDGPLYVGQTWTLEFTATCGTAAPITYTQSGTVVDIESVTVPTGTYTALRLQSTVTWTAPDGGARTETIMNWRDTTGLGSVRQEITYTYGAPLPTNGYAVSRQIVRQAATP
jgi:hypothetical protein